MAVQVCNGATLTCTFGAAPAVLTVLPARRVLTGGQPAATIMDSAPMVNVSPFAMCISPTNPQVAAATAAALGVLTPQPCIPAVAGPWSPGDPTVLIGGQPALVNTDMCTCMWGGVVTIGSPGQVSVVDG